MKRLNIAIALNSAVALLCLIIGVNYLFRSTMTTYHLTAIGVDWETLAEGVQLLLVILMKGTGDALIVMALSILILTWIPLRQQQNWASIAILAVGASCLVPMLVGAIMVATSTGAASPWWLNALLLSMLATSAALTWRRPGAPPRT